MNKKFTNITLTFFRLIKLTYPITARLTTLLCGSAVSFSTKSGDSAPMRLYGCNGSDFNNFDLDLCV